MLDTDDLPRRFGERLKSFRLSRGLTMAELGEAIGHRQGSIAVVESGRNMLSVAAVAAPWARFGLNAHWLITGYGSMLIPPRIGQATETPGDYEARYPAVTVPLLSSLEDLGRMNAPECGVAEILHSLVPHPGSTYGVTTRGDSMAPVIRARFLVLIDVHPDAIRPYEQLHGAPVAVRLEGGLSIRWFEAGKRDWVLYVENEAAGIGPLRIPRQVAPPVEGRVTWWCPPVL